MNELKVFATVICNNLQNYGVVSPDDIQEIEGAVCCDLGEVVFVVCKVLIGFGFTKQEENNRIALEVLAKSILRTIEVIGESGGKYSHLFYSWIDYSEREESDSRRKVV